MQLFWQHPYIEEGPTIIARRSTDIAKVNTERPESAMILPSPKPKGESLMKAKLSKALFALVCVLVGIVQVTAALAAGGASHLTSYQPKVPEQLRR